ncbi:MAG: hypothetical protein Q8J84_00975 [Flavobacteriaceae bacterium]|nr:hypothetical protein [Flavobacteriaceae bacterium]
MHRCKHIPQPLKADPQAKAVVRASTSPAREKLFFKISFPSKNFKNANPQTDTKTFGQLVAKLNTDKGCKTRSTRTPGHNSTYKKLAVQWLNEVQFFKQTFVQVDSLVLLNRQLLIAAKRYGLWESTFSKKIATCLY